MKQNKRKARKSVDTMLNGCMGRKIKVKETVSHKSKFEPSDFCAPVKVAPMARVMPAIPLIRNCSQLQLHQKARKSH